MTKGNDTREEGMGVQQQRRERHDDNEENAKEEGGYNDEEEGGDATTTRNDTPRSRKVGDNIARRSWGHNDQGHGPSTHFRVPRLVNHIILYVDT